MRSRNIVAALFVTLSVTGSASAQVLSLEFHDGHVRLTAENVPVSQILAEWARVGGTRIVNGERVPGAPVTLEIVDAPERQALDTVLRGAAGYMVLARDTIAPGGSAFDKIMVLATTSRAPAAAALPSQPAAQPPQVQNRPEQEPIEIEEANENPQQAPLPPAGFPRGRVPAPGLNLPNGANANPTPPRENEAPPPTPEPPMPGPGNPFGVNPGNSRPGTINPVPPPRDPNAQTPR
jgi:hypothetical protein